MQRQGVPRHRVTARKMVREDTKEEGYKSGAGSRKSGCGGTSWKESRGEGSDAWEGQTHGDGREQRRCSKQRRERERAPK
jgi:hypothetical protein